MDPRNPDVVFACALGHSFGPQPERGVYRTTDGGRTWAQVLKVDENRLYFASVSWSVSIDGGQTFDETAIPAGHDNHDIWIDPANPARVLVANDEGASISLNRGKSYQEVVLPIAQMYHAYTDNQIPYNVYGNRQDGSSYRGPSNSLGGGFNPFGPSVIQIGLWETWAGARAGSRSPIRRTTTSSGRGATTGQDDRRRAELHRHQPRPDVE